LLIDNNNNKQFTNVLVGLAVKSDVEEKRPLSTIESLDEKWSDWSDCQFVVAGQRVRVRTLQCHVADCPKGQMQVTIFIYYLIYLCNLFFPIFIAIFISGSTMCFTVIYLPTIYEL
jgi:hypothetical protein